MKKLFLFFSLILMYLTGYCQVGTISHTGYKSKSPADSASFQSQLANPRSSGFGDFWYNWQASQWRAWSDGVEINPFKIANNGLSSTFNNYQLGGTFIKNTSIDASTFIFTMSNLGGLHLAGTNASTYFRIDPGDGHAHINSAEDITLNTDSDKGIKLTGNISLNKTSTLSAFSVDQNNLVVGRGFLIQISSTVPVNITGIVPGTSVGTRWLTLWNSGSNAITLKNEDTNSTSGNRFSFFGNSDIVIGSNATISLFYNQILGRWMFSSSAIGDTTIPPPTQQSSLMTFTNITSTSVTATVTSGNGNGVLMVLAQGPATENPQNNVFYTADPVFGSGDAIGSAYVVFAEDGNSVNITGLTPNTNYQGVAYEYSASGFFISYNTSAGTNGFVTLAAATTPTTAWVTTSIKPKETSLRVTGVRGNGDNIVVVANDSIPVSIDIPDGTDPVSGSFGAGTHLGNRNYVVYEGSSSQFNITGLNRDRRIWWKVYEREDTGFLYNIQSSIDSAFTAYIYDSLFISGVGDPPGQVYLESSGNVWYKLSNLTTADEVNVSNGDAGLVDLSPGTNTATILGVPVTNEITFNGTQKTARTTSTSALNVNNTGNVWFSDASGFEIHWSGQVSDGIAGTGGQFISFCGTLSNNSQVSLRVFDNGTIQVNYRDGVQASATNWAASNFLVDGVNTLVIQVRFDFVNDLITIYKNGAVFTSGFQSGTAFSSQDPTNFNGTSNFVVGNFSNSGTLSGNTTGATVSTAQFAVTPLLTVEQRDGIYQEFNFTAAAGAAFEDWDVIETDPYAQSTVNDTLNLSGAVSGFDNFIRHLDAFPDSLEEFEVVVGYKIDAALTTNPSGIGVGFINSTSDPNYSAFGHLNNDTDAGQFGQLELFTGNGSAGFSNVTFRGSSSGSVTPAQDSVYWVALERDRQNNDAFYSLKIYDYSDSLLLTTGYLETNAPSTTYFANGTMKPVIWYQGPAYKVFEFWVVRTGEETGVLPGPVTGDAYVATTGDDSGTCTQAAPCKTNQRGLARIAELGGSDRTLITAAGIYQETSYLIIPTNLGLWQGAGKGSTFIQGTDNLNATFSYLASSKAMLQALSSSNISVTTHIKGITFIGGSPTARLKNNGLFVRRRNGFIVEDCQFRYFNTSGMWIDHADSVRVINTDFIESGGGAWNPANHGGVPWQNPATGWPTVGTVADYLTGNIMLYGNIYGFEMDGGSITARTWGAGIGIKSGGPTPHASFNITQDSIRIHHATLETNPAETGGGGPGFVVEFHDGLQESSDVFGDFEIDSCTIINGAISLVSFNSAANEGAHLIRHNKISGDITWFIESDCQNLEVSYNHFASTARMWCSFAGSSSKTFNNHHYHHNLVELGASTTVTHRFVSTNGTLSGAVIEHNNFIFSSNAGPKWELVYLAPLASSSNSLTIQNNAAYGDNPGDANLYRVDGGGFTGTIVRYNFSTHLNFNQSLTGVTPSNNTIGGTGSTWFNFTGSKWPVVTGGYYATGASSPLRDAAHDASDVGVYQHE